MLGYERTRLVGYMFSMFAFSRDEVQRLLGHLRSCRLRKQGVRTKLVLKALDETSALHVELLSHPLENEKDRFHTALIDQTEQAKQEAALCQARDAAETAARAKDEFIATLSHELRTPLNPVLLIASENASNPDLPEETRDDFAVISKNITLEARLIDDMLDLTRIIRGKLMLEQRAADPNAVLVDALNNVRLEFAQKKIFVSVELCECPQMVFAGRRTPPAGILEHPAGTPPSSLSREAGSRSPARSRTTGAPWHSHSSIRG